MFHNRMQHYFVSSGLDSAIIGKGVGSIMSGIFFSWEYQSHRFLPLKEKKQKTCSPMRLSSKLAFCPLLKATYCWPQHSDQSFCRSFFPTYYYLTFPVNFPGEITKDWFIIHFHVWESLEVNPPLLGTHTYAERKIVTIMLQKKTPFKRHWSYAKGLLS